MPGDVMMAGGFYQIRVLASGSEKEPDDEAEQGEDEDPHDPGHLGARGGVALHGLDDGIDVGDEEQEPQKTRYF